MDLTLKKTIEYKGSNLKCITELDGAKNQFEMLEALEKTMIVSLKEGKKHVTYSLDEAEEKALYQILKERNEHKRGS